MNTYMPPSDEDIERSVTNVQPLVFARLRKPAKRSLPRVAAAGLTAVALFGGGLAVGAAAYAAPDASPALPTSSGVPVPPTPGPSEFAFSIDCYTGPDPAQVFIGLGFDQSNDPTGLLLASARANPVGTCDAQKVIFAQGSVYGETIADRLVNGSDQCLVMNMTGAGPEYAWIFAGEQHVPFWEEQPTTSDIKGYASGAGKPAGFPADCQQVTVPKPTVDTPPLAACTVDVQHVSVYLLGTQTTEQVCQSHGYDVRAG